MFSMDVKGFCLYFGRLEALSRICELTVIDDPDETISEEIRTSAKKCVKEIRKICVLLNASATIKQIDRVLSILKESNVESLYFNAQFCEIRKRFIDDIDDKLFYLPEPHKDLEFSYNLIYFDDIVITSFPSCKVDFEEALECYFLGKHTACVFHLMRVLEIPLRTLGNILLPKDSKPNWDPVIKKITAELSLPYSLRAIKGDERFYSELAAQMHAVKLAWRNRVMHIDSLMNEEQAKSILHAVVNLMNHISENLTEKGEFSKVT